MIIKIIYCNEIAFNDLNAIYYIGKNNCLENSYTGKNNPLYFIAFFLVAVDSNTIYPCINPKLHFYHLITPLALLLCMLDENMPNNTICYYGKILCAYWVAYSSFFLIKLYFKYDTFKKSMNEYEKKFNMQLLIDEQREKLTIFL